MGTTALLLAEVALWLIDRWVGSPSLLIKYANEQQKFGSLFTPGFSIDHLRPMFVPFLYLIELKRAILFFRTKSESFHSKQFWVVSTQIWVKYGQTQMLG